MSGHSKWATTKRAKGAVDAKRGALFTKLAKMISVAARQGGGEPESNFKLRLAIDKAKESNMPKDNIDRAIKRGAGQLEGGQIEEVSYEGFGPDGTAFIIEAVTDNRNRTSSEVKHLLSKYGGNLGGPNSVSWLFTLRGVLRVTTLSETDELAVIDAGAQDIIRESDEVTIYTEPADLQKVKRALEDCKQTIEYGQIEQVPKELKTVGTDAAEKIDKLFAELEDDQDVSNYYTNARPPES